MLDCINVHIRQWSNKRLIQRTCLVFSYLLFSLCRFLSMWLFYALATQVSWSCGYTIIIIFGTHIFILIVCLFNTLSLNPWCAKGKCLFIIMCFFLAPFAFNLRIAKWRCSNTHNFRESFIIITKEKCTRRSPWCVFFAIRKCYNMQDKNETLLLWNAYDSERN